MKVAFVIYPVGERPVRAAASFGREMMRAVPARPWRSRAGHASVWTR
jgi:hypothetical protein